MLEDLDDTLFSKGGLLYGCTKPSWYTLHKKLRELGYADWEAGDQGTIEAEWIWISHPLAGKVMLGKLNSVSRKKVENLAKHIDTCIAERMQLIDDLNDAYIQQRILVRRREREVWQQYVARTQDLLRQAVKGFRTKRPRKSLPRRGNWMDRILAYISF